VLFRGIRDRIINKQQSIIQIHLIPSESCLELYRLHGVRQYSPRTLSKVGNLFLPFSHLYLFKLGGKNCYRVHHQYITQPLVERGIDLRDVQTKEYQQDLQKAVVEDMKNSNPKPIFYAFIIHSFPKQPIF